MSSKRRWDLCTARPKGGYNAQAGDVWWHRIGTAIENDKGQIVLFFDSLPIPDSEGKVSAMGFIPKPREEQRQGSSGGGRPAKTLTEDLDDEIPF